MSESHEGAEEEMRRAIFIPADCWLAVFALLAPSQLGLQIALLSHRFDRFVDEHFKIRKWSLGYFQICHKFGQNGTKEMQIDNLRVNSLPIAQVPVPNKIIGMKFVCIRYIDQNVVAFLLRLRPLFASVLTFLAFDFCDDRFLSLFLRFIWPILKHKTRQLAFTYAVSVHSLRLFLPSILSDANCPSLRKLSFSGSFFPAFPANDSVKATEKNDNASSAAQAVAKWLFSSPRPDGVPKELYCLARRYNWSSTVKGIKTAFLNASSPANFIIRIHFQSVDCPSIIVPFHLVNQLTQEQLTLKHYYDERYLDRTLTPPIWRYVVFLLVRSPLLRDESKWTKWEKEAYVRQSEDEKNPRNVLSFGVKEDGFGDGLLDATLGPNGHSSAEN